MLEIIVRWFLVSPNNLVYDARLGWQWPPNETFALQTVDAGFRRVSVNSLGFNDDEVISRQGHSRLLVLGDSFVEAFQVDRADNFLKIVERNRSDLQLVNIGRSGRDPVTELVVLDQLSSQLMPDGVIMVLNSSDEQDLLRDRLLVKPCSGSREICDFRLPRQSGGAVQILLVPLMKRSSLLTYLGHKYQPVINDAIDWLHRTLPARFFQSGALYSGGPAINAEWRRLNPDDMGSLLRLVFARANAKHPLTVVFIPSLKFATDRHTELEGSDVFIAQSRRAALAAGARFINVREALAVAYAETGQPPTGFDFSAIGSGHLNGIGHRAVAALLARELAPSTVRATP